MIRIKSKAFTFPFLHDIFKLYPYLKWEMEMTTSRLRVTVRAAIKDRVM